MDQRFPDLPPRTIFNRFLILFALVVGMSGVLEKGVWADDPLGSAKRPLNMMFVPAGDSQVILAGGKEIAGLLQKITGLHFKASVATSYAAAIEGMGAGKVDIGWLAAFAYVLAKKKHDVQLLLINDRFGSPFYRGQIVVSKGNGIKSLADLKGKRFAYVDPASTSGHLYPKSLLIANGLDPDRMFSKIHFAGSHNAVILSVMKGEVDAGATYDDARTTVAQSYPDIFDKVDVLAYTDKIPNSTISVRKELGPTLSGKIKQGLKDLSRLPEGLKMLKRTYGITGFKDLDAFFDPVRKAHRLLNLKEE